MPFVCSGAIKFVLHANKCHCSGKSQWTAHAKPYITHVVGVIILTRTDTVHVLHFYCIVRVQKKGAANLYTVSGRRHSGCKGKKKEKANKF